MEGRVFVLAMLLSAMKLGPILGLFTLGMLFPRANSKVQQGVLILKNTILHVSYCRVHSMER
jgi:Kef-type K+ transport system membrane component KefB